MNADDIQFLIEKVKAKSGIALTPEKSYLLETRLQPVARSSGFDDISGLVAAMRKGGDSSLEGKVVEAMTTNESMFFRDNKPFEALKEFVLPRMVEHKKTGKLRIWNAACSNGQESYSTIMTLLENPQKMGTLTSFEIIGTDIAPKVVEKATAGTYTQFEVQRGMPITLLLKYFDQREGNEWQVKESLKKHVQYRVMNLLDSYMTLGKFDIVMCRNVLIYFEDEIKKQILEKIHKLLPPHGVLFVGSSETVHRVTDVFEPVAGKSGLYTVKA